MLKAGNMLFNKTMLMWSPGYSLILSSFINMPDLLIKLQMLWRPYSHTKFSYWEGVQFMLNSQCSGLQIDR